MNKDRKTERRIRRQNTAQHRQDRERATRIHKNLGSILRGAARCVPVFFFVGAEREENLIDSGTILGSYRAFSSAHAACLHLLRTAFDKKAGNIT